MFTSSRSAVRVRGLLVWSAVSAVVAVLASAVAPAMGRAHGGDFADLLVAGCAVAALAAAGWLWVITTSVLLEVLRGAPRSRPASPVHALVLLACGAAVLGGTTTAASASSLAPSTPDPQVLAGLPLPDRATGGPVDRPPAPTSADALRPRAPATATVRAGDSLWSLAEERLGPGADPADIAAYWLRIHALNHDAIGPDPDLIHPGLRLDLPPT